MITGKRTSPADFYEFIRTIFMALQGSTKTIAHKTGSDRDLPDTAFFCIHFLKKMK
jgi:hypothetical protein